MRDEFEQIYYFKNQLLYDGVNPSEKVWRIKQILVWELENWGDFCADESEKYGCTQPSSEF